MAKQFQFRLATVLKLRRQERDEQQRVVAARLRQIAAVQARLGQMNEQLSGESDALHRLARPTDDGMLDMDALRRHRHYANHLHHTIATTRGELAGLERELVRERAALAEASKNVKVLEKLEEKQRRRHELAIERQERAEADELGTQYVRRRGSMRRVGVSAGQGS